MTAADPSPRGAQRRAWEVAAAVPDPEIPVLTIGELGVLRTVRIDRSGAVGVTLTPTYSGCPATAAIRADVADALRGAGFSGIQVSLVLSPAWSTDWISAAGRRALADYGIAPPGSASRSTAGPPMLALAVRCPRCGSPDTTELSRFGSTPCKALWRCRSCAEPFDRVKPL